MLKDEAEKYLELGAERGEEYSYNCAEIMLNAANDYYKLGMDKRALNMVLPLGGGMYREKDCGMLTGGAAALGAIFTEEKPSKNLKVQEATGLWVEKFEEEFKSVNCRVIKKENLQENESCDGLILKAADLLEEVISKYK